MVKPLFRWATVGQRIEMYVVLFPCFPTFLLSLCTIVEEVDEWFVFAKCPENDWWTHNRCVYSLSHPSGLLIATPFIQPSRDWPTSPPFQLRFQARSLGLCRLPYFATILKQFSTTYHLPASNYCSCYCFSLNSQMFESVHMLFYVLPIPFRAHSKPYSTTWIGIADRRNRLRQWWEQVLGFWRGWRLRALRADAEVGLCRSSTSLAVLWSRPKQRSEPGEGCALRARELWERI